MSAFTCYCTGHVHSRMVLGAFAAGACLPVAPPETLRDGGVAVYGILRGGGHLLKQAQAANRNWVYLDNGYFRPGHYDGFYRVTRDAYQRVRAVGTFEPDFERWRKLGISMKPWQTNGRHVLVCPPGPEFAAHLGIDRGEWLLDVTQALRAATDREIRVRVKPAKGRPGVPLAADLENCHAVVAYNSNVAVEALLAGVPVWCHAMSAAAPLAGADWSQIESPLRPDDREPWAADLAANQWTIDEMLRGTCARALGIA